MFFQLGQHLNRAMGYDAIDILKRRVVEQETKINAARQVARAAKVAYDEAVLNRAAAQRDVNELERRWRGSVHGARPCGLRVRAGAGTNQGSRRSIRGYSQAGVQCTHVCYIGAVSRGAGVE